MNQNELLGFYKEMYYFELQRRDRLASALTLPIGIVVIIVGGLLYYVPRLPPLSADPWIMAFFVTFGLGVLSTITAVYFLARSAWNHAYGYIPTPSEIEAYRQALVQYYRENPGVAPGVDTDFESFLSSQFLSHTERNTLSNDRRSAYLHRGLCGILLAIIFLALSIVPFYRSQASGQHAATTGSRVIHPSKEKDMTEEKKDQQSEPEQQPSATPPPKPKPPSGRVLKEYQRPPAKPKK